MIWERSIRLRRTLSPNPVPLTTQCAFDNWIPIVFDFRSGSWNNNRQKLADGFIESPEVWLFLSGCLS